MAAVQEQIRMEDFHGVCDDKPVKRDNQAAEEPPKHAEQVVLENLEIDLDDLSKEEMNLWTLKNIGVPLTGFLVGYLIGILTSTRYGFFLGYLGLKPYVLMAIGSISRLPEVLLLPMGILCDSVPIMGMHRKPYLLIAWSLVAAALFMSCVRPLPDPYYCLGEDGNFDFHSEPCNPSAHEATMWYGGSLVLISLGGALAQVSGEGLLISYSQREPLHCRGKIKTEVTMMITAGQLIANLTVAFFMNSKEYLGTFDWGLGYDGIMIITLVLVVFLFFATIFGIEEPQHFRSNASGNRTASCWTNLRESWRLMKNGAFMAILMFSFVMQMMINVNTTAGPLVKSQWAEVKVLPQQLYHMASSIAEIFAVWMVKRYLLQSSWRKIFFSACIMAVVLDAVPAFLTVFAVVRNQYFYLGEEILSAVPIAAIKLISGLVLIEMAEPGREGLCIGLMGTVSNASAPLGTAVGNQIFALFHPNLSEVKNYVQDSPHFRQTVAWSYVLTYATTLASFSLIHLLPNQKLDAHHRKRSWSTRASYGLLVLALPGIGCCYSLVLLVLTNITSTSCLEFVGGGGCE